MCCSRRYGRAARWLARVVTPKSLSRGPEVHIPWPGSAVGSAAPHPTRLLTQVLYVWLRCLQSICLDVRWKTWTCHSGTSLVACRWWCVSLVMHSCGRRVVCRWAATALCSSHNATRAAQEPTVRSVVMIYRKYERHAPSAVAAGVWRTRCTRVMRSWAAALRARAVRHNVGEEAMWAPAQTASFQLAAALDKAAEAVSCTT